ncbi:MAG: SNF2-related protein, partial [Synergistaceae bacterium]|nr:SNF2-related protein [Synergistaceae bacterium]
MGCGGIPHHLFDPGAEKIASSLSELGFEYPYLSRKEKLKMKLPSLAGKYPIPSTPMLGELPKTPAAKVANAHEGSSGVPSEWLVEALPLGAAELFDLRGFFAGREQASPDGRFLAQGLMASLDLCYVMECFSYAVSLLAHGKFLPGIKLTVDGKKYESLWSPVLIGDDAARLDRLEALAPDVIRGREGAADNVGKFDLRDMISEMMDGIIRLAWSKRGARDRGASQRIARAIVKNTLTTESPPHEKKRRGKMVNALNPHELWIRSLGWMGETDGLSQSLGSIYRQVRDWRGRYEWFEHAPFKMIVRMWGDVDIYSDKTHWRLEYALGIPLMNEAIPARAVWSGSGQSSSDAGAYMRRFLLLMLGRIGAMFHPVRESLDSAAPEGCAMSHSDVADFLQNCAPLLPEMGVDIQYPDWWVAEARDLLSIKGTQGDGDDAYKWKLAWRGRVLSAGELNALFSAVNPFVQIREEWVFMPREHLEEISSHIDGLPERLSMTEAAKLAIKDPFVDGFEQMPELESVCEALRKGTPPEILDVPGDIRGELRPYQQRGYSWLAFLSGLGIGACLADDMGLGKTLQTLALVRRCRDLGNNRPVMLICPTSVIENWRTEMIKFFPSMTYYVHHGHERLRGEKFAREASVSAMVFTSYAL